MVGCYFQFFNVYKGIFQSYQNIVLGKDLSLFRASLETLVITMRLAIVATCNLNQWAMDFQGNLERIKQSIIVAKERGATYRIGPELEISGYGCEDHFLEPDTFQHAWEAVTELIASNVTDNILVDVGLPILHRSVSYNCRCLIFGKQIILIRPKLFLADDGNYRESRWFRAWQVGRSLESYQLPDMIIELTGQKTCPFGEAIIEAEDTTLAVETCEELFTLDPPHIKYLLNGVEILANSSGSHHHLRKLDQRLDLLRGATAKGGGIYLYSNQIGCDGGRLYFDGCACICVNGQLVAQGSQFSLESEVEVVTAVVDLDDVVSHRLGVASRGVQATITKDVCRIQVPELYISQLRNDCRAPNAPIAVRIHHPMEEIALGPACWLWDYLRRSNACGFFLPLSGGADSSSTAAIVGSMCQLLCKAVEKGCVSVLLDIRRICGDAEYTPSHPGELAFRLFHTCFMGSVNSSTDTRMRSKLLAEEIGAYHLDINIDIVVESLVKLFFLVFGKTPRFRVHGGSDTENLALQNIQARIRMVIAYFFAQMLPYVRRNKGGSLLVLGSANVDEGLRGYLTKYDCSSADINPIGGISKRDLKSFLYFASKPIKENGLGYSSLIRIVEAPPTAELEPITCTYTQTDEADMGMTYEELNWYGRLRKLSRCGPVSMFLKLCTQWKHLTCQQVAEKVKFFFRMYSINRHKMTTLTPSYHAENYSPEDNRFDLRQFLYHSGWHWQFSKMDELKDKQSMLTKRFPTDKLKKTIAKQVPSVVLINFGSFSPLTMAHLLLMESAYNYAHYNGLHVLGGYLSPVHDSYGKPGLVSSEHRVEMCRLAVKDSSWLMVDDWECLQSEYLPTFRVMRHFCDQLFSQLGSDIRLILVCGYDLYESLFHKDIWPREHVEKLLETSSLFVVPRIQQVDGYSMKKQMAEYFPEYIEKVTVVETAPLCQNYGGFFFTPASNREKTKALVIGKLGETVKTLAAGSKYLPNKAQSWLKVANSGYAVLLELVGVGFRAQEEKDRIVLRVGFTHPVYLPKEKDGVQYHVLNQTLLSVVGIDERKVRVAAGQVRLIRPPDPYKGKGIRYLLEQVRLKEGKKK
eukprot:jgi/Galph1/29/GphlegSOOS_G4858.1